MDTSVEEITSNLVCGVISGAELAFTANFFISCLEEDQPLRLLLNLFFYHFNRYEPTYKLHRIKLPDVIAACSQLNINALN